MADHASVGFWVRRFLSEHLIHERGVSRNTQQSYRDTFCLLLPFMAAQRKTAVDKLVMDDLSPTIVSGFLAHWNKLEIARWLLETKGLPLSMLSLGLRANAALSMWNGANRFAMFHSNELGKPQCLTWRKMKLKGSLGHQIAGVNRVGEIPPCYCFFTTQGHVRRKRLELRLRI
jgi:hypothetical protein